MNDITIIMGVVFVFVGLGFIMPYIHEDFNTGETIDSDLVSLETKLQDDYDYIVTSDDIVAPITIWHLIWSVLKMFVWTFGSFPIWIDALIFLPMRIMFFVTIARNIHIGGGS